LDARFVIILENNYNKLGRTVFEVLGWEYGLEVNIAVRDANDEDMRGGWYLVAGSQERVKESNVPFGLFIGGSLANTRIAIEDLFNPNPIPIPDTPVATAITDALRTGFTCNWNTSTDATGYYLDIATDSGFTTFATGFNNKDVGLVLTYPVTLAQGIYYVRVRAYNSAGTSASSNSITADTYLYDLDLNQYSEVVIGTQIWINKNLAVTKYADGSAIPNITDNTLWAADTTGAYCWYNNDSATYKATYGGYYNYPAVINAKGLAYLKRNGALDAGWRVPADTDFEDLSTGLGGDTVSGGKLKEAGTEHWNSPNTGADNSSGFTAFGGGWRFHSSGEFQLITNYGQWWSSTFKLSNAYSLSLSCNASTSMIVGGQEVYGYSVRLVRDNV
jgi:uncharacterized protein (TIGR02145 family)